MAIINLLIVMFLFNCASTESNSNLIVPNEYSLTINHLVNNQKLFTQLPLNIESLLYLNKKYDLINYRLQNTKQISNHNITDNDECSLIIDEIITKIVEYLIKPDKYKNDVEWLLYFIDSYGKIPSGILNGNIAWVGDFRECVNLKVNEKKLNFIGKYCLVNWSIKSTNVTNNMALRSGVCLPDKCSNKSMEQLIDLTGNLIKHIPIINKIVDKSGIEIDSIKCLIDPQLDIDGHIFNYSCLLIFIVLLIATLIDVYCQNKYSIKYYDTLNVSRGQILINKITNGETSNNDQQENDVSSHSDNNEEIITEMTIQDDTPIININDKQKTYSQIIYSYVICFSLYTNAKKLFTIKSKNIVIDGVTKDPEIKFIHGIKVISMWWLIVAHAYLFALVIINNVKNEIDDIDNLPFYVIMNAAFSADTFFLLSGFLLFNVYYVKHQLNTNTKYKWFYYYVHRYLRLTPLLAIIIWFMASVSHTYGNGPFWDYGDTPTSQRVVCKKYWWTNLLYINNFWSFKELCTPWTWYLANDMQFYVIGPIFLIALTKYSNIGVALVIITILCSWLTTGLLNYFNDFPFTFASQAKYVENTMNINKAFDYFDKIFIRPYCRISAFLIGLLTSYVYHKYSEKLNSMKNIYLTLGSLISLTLTLVIIFSTYHNDLTLIEASIYNALSRSVWSLSIAWLLLMLLIGKYTFINKFLSYRLWFPLSRLTYCVYLIHPLIIISFYDNLKETMDFTHIHMLIYSSGFIFSVYLISILITLLFESPIIELEKRFFVKVTT